MSDFDEVRLELGFDYSAVGGQYIKTDVMQTDSGQEQVITGWVQLLGEWDVGTRNMTEAEKDYIVSFYRARQGTVRGFRFKDWSDFKAENQQIGIGDGTTTSFQLTKSYESGGITDIRTIKKPVSGTVKAYINGVEDTNITVDTTTGIITFGTAPGTNSVITASFEFDVPVRFVNDRISVAVKAYDPDTGKGIFFLSGLTVRELLL